MKHVPKQNPIQHFSDGHFYHMLYSWFPLVHKGLLSGANDQFGSWLFQWKPTQLRTTEKYSTSAHSYFTARHMEEQQDPGNTWKNLPKSNKGKDTTFAKVLEIVSITSFMPAIPREKTS